MKRLAILLTHPIQYYVPVFRLLQQGRVVQPMVFYTCLPDHTRYDQGFGQEVNWDIPLLEGYDYQFQQAGNRSQNQVLVRAIEQWRPQAILVYGWNPPGHLAVMRYFKGKIPVWFRGDSTMLDEKPGLRQWARRWFLRWVYRHVDLAFYVGTQNRRYFEAHGLKKQQLHFAPHAIDNERFSDVEGKNYGNLAAAWRQDLSIPETDFVILFAGKFEPKKAPNLLLEAFKHLQEEKTLPSLQLVFVGSGELESELKQVAKKIPNVHFLGFQNQSKMPVVYRLGNLFVLPSKGPGETWGLAVNESLASGTPVLVSDKVGCAIDLATPSASSIVFEAGNLDSLKQSLKEQILRLSKDSILDIKINTCSVITNWSFEQFTKVIELTILDRIN